MGRQHINTVIGFALLLQAVQIFDRAVVRKQIVVVQVSDQVVVCGELVLVLVLDRVVVSKRQVSG